MHPTCSPVLAEAVGCCGTVTGSREGGARCRMPVAERCNEPACCSMMAVCRRSLLLQRTLSDAVRALRADRTR